MGSEEKNTIETQIRSACPQEAIGYRLVVLTTTPTVYPIRALHGRDYYIVNPDLVEFPTGTPVGLHQLQFVDAGGSTIPLSRQIKVRIAAEEQTEQASDEDEPEGQEPAPSGDTGAASFQSKAQELVLQRRRLRNARMARKTSEIGEYHAHWSGLFEDTVRRLERLDELSKLHHEAQLAITQRMTTELTKIPGPPPPPPPPQDWVGLIKTGIEGVQSVVTTAINARGSAKSLESGPMTSELSDKLAEKLAEKLTERLVDKLASRLSGRGAIEAVSTTADAMTAAGVSAAPAPPAPAPIQSAAVVPLVAQASAAAAAPAPIQSAAVAPPVGPASAAAAAPAPVSAAAPMASPGVSGAAASNAKAEAPPASNNDKDPPAPPAAPSVRADAPAPVAKPTENVYARSWLAMRRVIAKLTDLDIIDMVANPALLVSFIGLLAALAPESIQSALPQPIPQEAHR